MRAATAATASDPVVSTIHISGVAIVPETAQGAEHPAYVAVLQALGHKTERKHADGPYPKGITAITVPIGRRLRWKARWR